MSGLISWGESEGSKSLLMGALDAIARLEETSDEGEKELLKEHPQDIDSLNRYLHRLEVDAGLLICPECGRWYPIGSAVETIPEMLPDDLREKDRDLEWMEKWSHLIPANVLEEGKPYNIKQ